MSNFTYYDSPIGLIEIAGSADAITSLLFVERRRKEGESNEILDDAVRQVAEYFAAERTAFELPLFLEGTEFQERVWRHLLIIHYGQLVTYQDVANALGNPQAVRAVGAANGQNPISIIVPCHRVVGSDGKLVGYGGGLWRKEWLLRHEGALLL